MKKKQVYVKPSMEVFKLKQQPALLAGSEGLGNPSDYPSGGDPLNPGS